MKKKEWIEGLLVLAGTIALLGFAGNEDFKDEVINSMSEETYEEVVGNLPEGASRADIVEEYLKNREWYD